MLNENLLRVTLKSLRQGPASANPVDVALDVVSRATGALHQKAGQNADLAVNEDNLACFRAKK